MAKLQRAGKPRRFSFENDPKTPTVFVWVEAPKDVCDEYQSQRQAIIAKEQATVFSKESRAALEALRIEFIFDRVTAVENLEDQDGNPLKWGTEEEKEKVLSEFRQMNEGPKNCFLDAIFVAHFPASIASYKAVVGGNF